MNRNASCLTQEVKQNKPKKSDGRNHKKADNNDLEKRGKK